MPAPPLPLKDTLTAGELTHLARTAQAEVQAAVAAHPNTPAAVLGQLGAVHPAEVLLNPALLLLRLANPQLLHGWPARTLERLATQPEAPDWVVRYAAGHPVIDVQLAAATRTDLPPDIMRTLCHSPFWTIRELMARQPRLPLELLTELTRDPDYGVRLTVTGRPDLNAELTDALRRDPHPLVRAVIHLADLERAGEAPENPTIQEETP